MTLLVEDGSGYDDSESYISVADATAYHVSRGNDTWSDGGVDEQESALRRATTWLDETYGQAFLGYRSKGREQALEWPRAGAYVSYRINGGAVFGRLLYGPYGNIINTPIAINEIPVEIKRATSEAALRELATPGVLRPDIVPGKLIKSVAVTGAISVTFADATPQAQNTIITIIGPILRPLLDLNLRPSALFGNAVRAS